MLLPDGTYSFSYIYIYTLPFTTDDETIWVYDPEHNLIRRSFEPETICGVYPLRLDNFVQEQWIIDEERDALCNLSTGETIPLPDELLGLPASYMANLGIGSRLTTYSSEDYIYVLGGYLYDLEVEEWRYIGRLPVDYGYLEVSLDDNLLIFYARYASVIASDGLNADKDNLLVANATQADSVQHISELPFRFSGIPFTSDGNGRIIWAETRGSYFSILAHDVNDNQTKILTESHQYDYEGLTAQSGSIPRTLHLNPDNPDVLLLTLRDTNNQPVAYIIHLPTHSVLGSVDSFIDWLSPSRYLARSGYDFLLDCVISPSYNGASCLEWLRPHGNLLVRPISPDKEYMLVMPFGDTFPRDEIQVVDMSTRSELDGIARYQFPENYGMEWYWQDDYSFMAEIDNQRGQTVARYHIALDALSNQ